MIIVIFIILFGLFLLSVSKYPDFAFWLALMVFFDPGGYVQGYLGGDLIGVLNVSDIFFVFMMIPLLFIKKISDPFKDKIFKKIFFYLIVFLLYYILIYGYVLPRYHGRVNFLFFLIKNRLFIYGLPMMYAVYIFSQRSLYLFFRILLFFSMVILTVYFITLLTGIPLIPVWQSERYTNLPGYTRISMLSYGLIHWILYLGMIIFFVRRRVKFPIKNKNLVYYGAVLMSVAILITLTRREYINLIFSVFILAYLVGYLYRIPKAKLFSSIVIPFSLSILFLLLIMSRQINSIINVSYDTYSILTTGRSITGREENRVTGGGEYEIVKEIIKNNILFGTGYVPWQWSDVVEEKKSGNELAVAWDASAEVPIYGAFMRFGILGIFLIIPIYLVLIKQLLKTVKILRKNIYHNNRNYIDIVFFLFVIYFFISKFTYQIFELFYEFYAGHKFVVFCVVLGMFFGLRHKMKFVNAI